MKSEFTTKNLATQCVNAIEEYIALFPYEERTVDVVLDSFLSHGGDICDDPMMLRATLEQLQTLLLNPEVLQLFHKLNPYNTEVGIHLSKMINLLTCLYDTIAADELTGHWVKDYGKDITEEKLRDILRHYSVKLKTEKFKRSLLEAKPAA